jgi:hypothetical protein
VTTGKGVTGFSGRVVRITLRHYIALAYLDTIDTKVDTVSESAEMLRAQVDALHHKIAHLQAANTLMAAGLEKVINLLGVVIPNWQTKEEVEEGDDMGMVNLSASELGLVVVFSFIQQAPGFVHEQVISISPPAGSLVARGASVAVEINLEG